MYDNEFLSGVFKFEGEIVIAFYDFIEIYIECFADSVAVDLERSDGDP